MGRTKLSLAGVLFIACTIAAISVGTREGKVIHEITINRETGECGYFSEQYYRDGRVIQRTTQSGQCKPKKVKALF